MKFLVQPQESGKIQENQDTNVTKDALISKRSWIATLVLCILLTGVHRIYVGKIGTGVCMLLMNIYSWFAIVAVAIDGTAVGLILLIPLLIWFVIDLINILKGEFMDQQGLPVRERRS